MYAVFFYLGKLGQAVGLFYTGYAVYRGIFHHASMTEELELVSYGLFFFLLGWFFIWFSERGQ
jgi:hypothetical protein